MLAGRLLVATTLIASFAVPAFAGEGAGDPFPGPDAVVHEDMSHPTYTMGADAPFNSFYAAKPTPMGGYHASPGASQDPFPFRANGQSIQTNR